MEAFVLLSAKKQLILDVIYKLESKKINTKEALLLLGVSERTLRRYVKKYRKEGVLFLKHGNQGRTAVNRLPSDLKVHVQRLVKEQYFDFNMSHCLERLFPLEKNIASQKHLGIRLSRRNCLRMHRKS